jgi:hypothetical protein
MEKGRKLLHDCIIRFGVFWKKAVRFATHAADELEKVLDVHLIHRAPYRLPHEAQMAVAKFLPYGLILVLVIQLPIILSLLGFGAFFTLIYPLKGLFFVARFLAMLIAFRCHRLAVKPLFVLSHKGRKYVYYGTVAAFVAMVLRGNIVMALVGGLIGWYLIFQVKHLYEKRG